MPLTSCQRAKVDHPTLMIDSKIPGVTVIFSTYFVVFETLALLYKHWRQSFGMVNKWVIETQVCLTIDNTRTHGCIIVVLVE